jgi:flagellar protein FliS
MKMMNSQMANAYKNQQIMTASPEQLTLLLYNGALRFLSESIQAMEQGDFPKSHNANLRVQDIVREFINTLDMNYELSKPWAQLYEYAEYCLIQGNVKKEVEQLQNAKGILEEMRDTWQEAMRQTLVARAAGK